MFAVILQQLNCSLGYVYVSFSSCPFLSSSFCQVEMSCAAVLLQTSRSFSANAGELLDACTSTRTPAYALKLCRTSCFAEHPHALKQPACRQAYPCQQQLTKFLNKDSFCFQLLTHMSPAPTCKLALVTVSLAFEVISSSNELDCNCLPSYIHMFI